MSERTPGPTSQSGSLGEAHAGARSSNARTGSVVAGRYQVDKLIARGGMATVYLAHQVGLNRPVALKVLAPPADADDAAAFETRFHLEARSLASLNHSNIVTVYDFGETDDGRFYLAMEYIDGPKFSDLLREGPLAVARAIPLIMQACVGLRYAHKRHVVHRDLKPSNILVKFLDDGEPLVKLVDFGLVKLTIDDQTITKAGLILGSPHCMAPEQVRGVEVDERADIYAVGVLLFRSLTGHYPFHGPNSAATMIAHLNEPVPPFYTVAPQVVVPEGLEDIVRRCLAKEPRDRFQHLTDLMEALAACTSFDAQQSFSQSSFAQQSSQVKRSIGTPSVAQGPTAIHSGGFARPSGSFATPSGAYPPPGTPATPGRPPNRSGSYPAQGSGAYPPPNRSGRYPAQGSGAHAPPQRSGSYPAQGSGANPPPNRSGSYPSPQASGAYPAQGQSRSGARPAPYASGGYPSPSGAHPSVSGAYPGSAPPPPTPLPSHRSGARPPVVYSETPAHSSMGSAVRIGPQGATPMQPSPRSAVPYASAGLGPPSTGRSAYPLMMMAFGVGITMFLGTLVLGAVIGGVFVPGAGPPAGSGLESNAPVGSIMEAPPTAEPPQALPRPRADTVPIAPAPRRARRARAPAPAPARQAAPARAPAPLDVVPQPAAPAPSDPFAPLPEKANPEAGSAGGTDTPEGYMGVPDDFSE